MSHRESSQGENDRLVFLLDVTADDVAEIDWIDFGEHVRVGLNQIMVLFPCLLSDFRDSQVSATAKLSDEKEEWRLTYPKWCQRR